MRALVAHGGTPARGESSSQSTGPSHPIASGTCSRLRSRRAEGKAAGAGGVLGATKARRGAPAPSAGAVVKAGRVGARVGQARRVPCRVLAGGGVVGGTSPTVLGSPDPADAPSLILAPPGPGTGARPTGSSRSLPHRPWAAGVDSWELSHWMVSETWSERTPTGESTHGIQGHRLQLLGSVLGRWGQFPAVNGVGRRCRRTEPSWHHSNGSDRPHVRDRSLNP